MSINWGPFFIVPSKTLKSYSGHVLLRESFDEELLKKELGEMGLLGHSIKARNPWYYRKKGNDTWIKIGESSDEHDNFSVGWETTELKNGEYEVLGLMHVGVKKDGEEVILARQNVVDVLVEN